VKLQEIKLEDVFNLEDHFGDCKVEKSSLFGGNYEMHQDAVVYNSITTPDAETLDE